MFEQSLLELAARNGRRKWTVAVSSAAQCGFVGLMILMPMLFTEAGPKLMRHMTIGPPPGRSESQPPGPRPRAQVRSEFAAGRLQMPIQIPDQIYTSSVPELAISDPGGVGVSGVPGSPGGGSVWGGTGTLMSHRVEPPPQPRPQPPVVTQRHKVGGDVQAAMAISRPQPLYPQLAKHARIQGVVRLEAIISKAGTIEHLQVLSGHPMLIPSALDAVRQWRYRPTILNGEPVEVVTTIEVHFTLSQ